MQCSHEPPSTASTRPRRRRRRPTTWPWSLVAGRCPEGRAAAARLRSVEAAVMVAVMVAEAAVMVAEDRR